MANASAPSFSVPLGVSLNLAAPPSPLALWAAWTRGCVDNGHGGMCYGGTPWAEPFTPTPLPPAGAPLLLRYGNLDSGAVHAPFGKVADSITLPLLSVQRAADDAAFTLVLSPEDVTTELLLRAEGGALHALRLFHRLAAGAPPVAFTCRLRAHAADWRPALGFWAAAHPAHVEPHVGGMERFEGLGGYSWQAPTNASYAASVGFKTNWDLSGTFMPYDGLFAPYQEDWLNLGPINAGLPQYNVTYASIDAFYVAVQAAGLNSLTYFDVGNWGVSIDTHKSYPNRTCGMRPGGGAAPCPDPNGSNAFLQHFLTPALLTSVWRVAGGTQRGPFPDWVGTTDMDPGEPFFQDLLAEQLARRVARVPHMQGIAIDRFDYTSFYNLNADDGDSWVPGGAGGAGVPARSLVGSHISAYGRLAGQLHAAGLCMLANCNTLCRADVMGGFDGSFSEGSALNAVAWTGLRRPTILWTYSLDHLALAPQKLHAYFQQHLLMRVFPMAPMPGNDHSINPGSPEVQAAYEAYAPLFDALRGLQWVLDAVRPVAHNLTACGGEANVFAAAAAGAPVLVVPLTLCWGGASAAVAVTPGGAPPASYDAEALLPGGGGAWVPLGVAPVVGGVALAPPVPLSYGGALLRLTPRAQPQQRRAPPPPLRAGDLGRIHALTDNGTTNNPNMVTVDLTTWEMRPGPELVGYDTFGQVAAVSEGLFFGALMDDSAFYVAAFNTTTQATVWLSNCSMWPYGGPYFLVDIFPYGQDALLVVGNYGSANENVTSIYALRSLASGVPVATLLGNVTCGPNCDDAAFAFDPATGGGTLFLVAGQSASAESVVDGTLFTVAVPPTGAPTVVSSLPLGGYFEFLQFDPVAQGLVGLTLHTNPYARNLVTMRNPGAQAWNVTDAGPVGEGLYVVLEDGPKAIDAATRRAFFMLATGPFAEFEVVALNLSTSPPQILETPGLCGFIGARRE